MTRSDASLEIRYQWCSLIGMKYDLFKCVQNVSVMLAGEYILTTP